MDDIRAIFSLLQLKQRELLRYSHSNRISQYIEYVPGRFIGVYAEHISSLSIELSHEGWSIGAILHNEVI